MLGHTKISTTQIYAKITDSKLGNEMKAFAGNVRKMEAKMQFSTMEEVKIDDVLQSLKISASKASEKVWVTLTEKVWQKMTNAEHQSFVLEMKGKENKPQKISDFYVVLMDSFLENLNGQSENSNVQSVDENVSAIDADIDKLAINF